MPETLNPNRFYCPHCGTENPPYIWVPQRANTPLGKFSYFTIVCGGMNLAIPAGPQVEPVKSECRSILGIALTEYERPTYLHILGG